MGGLQENVPGPPITGDDALIVNEIFYSIQGESSLAGLPCTFIRLTGCNLRCTYCDTRYAYEEGVPRSIEEILSLIPRGGDLVEVTGGEPLLQPATPRLVSSLLEEGFTVLVETNGSLDIGLLPDRCICILDVKCPGSGMSTRMDLENLRRLRPQDEVKFVVADRSDYLWAKRLLAAAPVPLRPPEKLLFTPVHDVLQPARLAEWILHDRLPVRLQVPLHRTLWPGETRGR